MSAVLFTCAGQRADIVTAFGRAGAETVAAGPVEPWSAELPRLYDGELRAGGETVRLRIGFRTVAVE